jgi:hypothetical protein
MGRKRETLDDLLPKAGLTAWCITHRINAKSLYSARRGLTEPTRGLLLQLATALGMPLERVERAAKASRK